MEKIITLLVLVCLSLSILSNVFFQNGDNSVYGDGNIETPSFYDVFTTIFGAIQDFGETMSGLFDIVIDFFTNVFSGITDFWNKVVEFFGGETAWEIENGSTYTNVL